MRIGHGFDAHALEAGYPLVIGGVRIPHDQGLRGHSDADVLIHALCDALLGAAGLGDIGGLFPDTDSTHAKRNSREFLEVVIEMLRKRGYRVVNVDSTVIAEMPKISPFVAQMRAILSNVLALDVSRVNIKATTTEGLGYIGRQDGIAAHAVVLLSTSDVE